MRGIAAQYVHVVHSTARATLQMQTTRAGGQTATREMVTVKMCCWDERFEKCAPLSADAAYREAGHVSLTNTRSHLTTGFVMFF
ncbi:hypothetical protein MSG28_003404 [Choristoneura fumiferana]|uniref:Uncharacterized protein n=1 Tax=Choristoneura fumiferana TaxID=7141 RepID=A0ACC0KFE0_CHOFU|nr:hypothetical protein MSG28_003404 [Choristoneura fumiferana]